MKKLAVAYYRVSTSRQDDERQEFEVKRHFEAQGIEIVETFREQISGAKRNKPELSRCLQYIQDNDIKYLVASELTRLGRTNEVLHIADQLTAMGVCICLQKENLNTLNDDGSENQNAALILNIMAGIAKNELHTIRYRVMQGRYNAVVNNGHFSGGGRGIYGYDVIDKRIVVNPVEAKVVKDIYLKFIEGWGEIRIANYLNSQGIPTKLASQNKRLKLPNSEDYFNTSSTVWGRSAIRNILINKIYIGIRTFRGQEFEQPELQIIDNSTFDIVQKKKGEHKQVNSDFNLKKKYSYLLDNKIIVCGECNRHYRGMHDKNTYLCNQNKYGKYCSNENIKMSDFDEFIKDFINKNYKNLVFDNKSISRKIEGSTSEKLQAEKQLKALQKKREKFVEMYADGTVSKDQMQKKVFTIDDEIETLEQNIYKLNEIITTNRLQLLENRAAELSLNNTNTADSNVIDSVVVHRLIKEIRVGHKVEGKRKIIIKMVNNEVHELEYK